MNPYTVSDALAQVTENDIGLGNIFNRLKVDADNYNKVIDGFKRLYLEDPNLKLDNGKANWDAITKAINGCDETALSYFKTLEDGNGVINNQAASIEGLTAHVNASNQSFGSAALKSALLNTALNAGIFLAVSVALQATVTAIDNYIHRNEILLEKAGEAQSRVNELSSSYSSHKKTVEELEASYDKLSQGVDTATNKNLSLSEEDYAEYLRITNELADTFPQLKSTIDENENAILLFSDKTKSAAENLRELLAEEQQIANYKISQELPDLFGGVSVKADELEAAKQKYDALSASASKYEEDLARLDVAASDDVFSLQTDNSQSGIAYYDALSSAVQQFTDTLPAAQKEFFDFAQMAETNNADISTIHFDLSSLDEGQKGKLQKIIEEEFGKVGNALNDQVVYFETELKDVQSQFDTSWNDFRSNLIKAMHSQATYQELDDTSKLLADTLVGNLPSEIESQMDSDKPYQWINDNIIAQLSKIDDAQLLSEFQNKIQKLLSFGEGDIDAVTYAEVNHFKKNKK